MHRSQFKRRLQWRLPILTATAVGIGSLLLNALLPATSALLHAGVLFVVGGALVYLLLRQPLQQLAQIHDFVPSLSTMHGTQLGLVTTTQEIAELVKALNESAHALHEQNNAIHVALAEFQGQQHAFDQHAIISMIDRDGALRYVNDRLCTFSGYERSSLLGRPYSMLSAEADSVASNQMILDKMLHEEIWHGEMRIRKKSGQLGWVDASWVPIRALSGETLHYICIQTDVTQRKEHEDALDVSIILCVRSVCLRSQFNAAVKRSPKIMAN